MVMFEVVFYQIYMGLPSTTRMIKKIPGLGMNMNPVNVNPGWRSSQFSNGVSIGIAMSHDLFKRQTPLVDQ